jgi:hypothetical protein
MSTHDSALLALRPKIPAVSALQAAQTLANDSIEEFHHLTLRPVMKLQHDALVDVCAVYASGHRSTFLQLPNAQKLSFLTNALKKEPALRNFIVGLVVGCFTEQERKRYLRDADDRTELNKRIIELAAVRAGDALESICTFVQSHS